MNIAHIGNTNPFKYDIKAIKGDVLFKKMNGSPKTVLDKSKIDDTLEPVLPYDRFNEYNNYRMEYTRGIFPDKQRCILTYSVEEMFKYAMDQFDQIDNSSDKEETKGMRRSALEEVLKTMVTGVTSTNLMRSMRINVMYLEKDKKIQSEMSKFQGDQFKAINNSVKKLTLNFLEYIKNNGGNDFEAMLKYVNKDSSNRDIYNLSISEFNGFLEYAKGENYVHTLSRDDANYYKGYFSTVSDGSDDSELNSKWKSTVFPKYESSIDISV